MIANAILSILATSKPLSLDDIQRMLSHFSYAGLRYRLARLQEDGTIERVGDAYRLRQEVNSQAGPARPTMSELLEPTPLPQAKHYRARAADARRDAANTNGETRLAYLIHAHQWEGLAAGTEDFVKSESESAPLAENKQKSRGRKIG
jgi:hypothetical protein